MSRGDTKALESLFRAHYADLVLYAQSLTGNRDLAEDIVQRVFITLWQRQPSLDPTQSIRGYLFAAVRNQAWNARRESRRESLRREQWTQTWQLDQAAIATDETHIDAVSLLTTLPDRDREVLDLRLRGLTLAEISQTLSVPLQTVAARIRRATERLREFIKHTPDA